MKLEDKDLIWLKENSPLDYYRIIAMRERNSNDGCLTLIIVVILAVIFTLIFFSGETK